MGVGENGNEYVGMDGRESVCKKQLRPVCFFRLIILRKQHNLFIFA